MTYLPFVRTFAGRKLSLLRLIQEQESSTFVILVIWLLLAAVNASTISTNGSI